MPSKAFGPTAGTADTKTPIGTDYTVPKGGRVTQARVTAYNGVADKAGTAILTIETDRQKGPFEYAVSLGGGLTDVYSLKESVIPISGMTLAQGEILTVSLTCSEATEDAIVSIEWA